MSVSFILLGLVLSAHGVEGSNATPLGSHQRTRLPVRFASVLLVFIYSLLVQDAGYAHNSRELALVKFIRENTTRYKFVLFVGIPIPGCQTWPHGPGNFLRSVPL